LVYNSTIIHNAPFGCKNTKIEKIQANKMAKIEKIQGYNYFKIEKIQGIEAKFPLCNLIRKADHEAVVKKTPKYRR
jgi:hypothetical protein